MSYLQFNALVKEYTKGKQIVKGINLDIEKEEFIVLLGPSGCGKTTTIRMIAGLESVSGGDILLDGKSIINIPAHKREFSMIFQSYAVWPHMTVYNNIAYPLKLRKLGKQEIDQAVTTCAKVCGLEEYLNRYPSQLSGGQRQRVAVARAIAVKPKIFLMDEPLSNLDAKLRLSVRTFLKEIHITNKSTTIFVTHDQSEAMALADRVVIMNNGFIEQVGTPYEVYSDCETVFVANFIGTPPANFMDVTLEKENDNYVIKNNYMSFPIDINKYTNLSSYVGKKIILAVRPENTMVTQQKGLFPLTVTVLEPQGAYSIIAAKVDEIEFKVIGKPEDSYKYGETIHIEFAPESCMFFDSETKKRIR